MSEIGTRSAKGRARGGKGAARATRREGQVPAVIYGGRQDPVLLSLAPRLIHTEMRKAGFSSRLFDLTVEGGETHRVMVQDVQFHPVTDMPIHVDFLRIGKDTEVTVAIPVHFINETASPGLKRGGVLNVVRHEIEVHGRPDALPDFFEVDLTGAEVGDSIHVGVVKIPEGVRPVIAERDFTICTIAAPSGLKSEEAAAGEAAAAAATPAA
ncbi:MAG TPA: 50S ribosomal protein L25 [Rhodospirillum rubrum]|nr:50S ribosomal protein L25 [Rhodospirillum rubrum]